MRRHSGKPPVLVWERAGIADFEDRPVANDTRPRVGYKGGGQVYTDHASLGPPLGHRQGQRSGATPHVEQFASLRKFHEVEKGLGEATSPATKPLLVCGSVARVKRR